MGAGSVSKLFVGVSILVGAMAAAIAMEVQPDLVQRGQKFAETTPVDQISTPYCQFKESCSLSDT